MSDYNKKLEEVTNLIDEFFVSNLSTDDIQDVMIYSNALAHKAYEFLMYPIFSAMDDDSIPPELKNQIDVIMKDSKVFADKFHDTVKEISRTKQMNLTSTILGLLINVLYLFHVSEMEDSAVSLDDISKITGQKETAPSKSKSSSFADIMKELDF